MTEAPRVLHFSAFIPKVTTCRSKRELELSKKRRAGYLAAISRADLTECGSENIRVCSRHFISGKPASLFDETSPDWLPTQNLGHPINVSLVSEERYERSKARRERRSVILATSQEEEPEEMDSEELDSENGPKGVERGVQTELCTSEISLLQQELNSAHEKIRVLEAKIAKCQPFTKTFLQSDECVQFYTGLPNYKMLKTVDFMSKRCGETVHLLIVLLECVVHCVTCVIL